jgi:putative endopeptidase
MCYFASSAEKPGLRAGRRIRSHRILRRAMKLCTLSLSQRNACLLASLALAAASASAQITLPELQALADDTASVTPTPPKTPRMFDMSAMDTKADPCTDFYQYVCGNWVKDNPIPPDQVRWGRFQELTEHNQYLLWQDLQKAAQPSADRSPLEAKYGDFYASCMNTEQVNQLGLKPLEPALERINALSDKKQLASVLSTLEREDGLTATPFRFMVQQDQMNSSKQIAALMQAGLALPDRSFYLDQGDRQEKLRNAYVQHMTKMFELTGDDAAKAAGEAKAVIAIETALAQGSLSRTDLRQPQNRYHIQSVADLEKAAPGFDWSAYFDSIGIGKFDTLNVGQPAFVETLQKQIDTESLDAWKSYLRWHVLHDAAPWLSDKYADENFDFFGKVLTGAREQQPRWKRCTRLTDQQLGEAVGQDWVKKNFPPEAKENMQKLVAALDKALAEDIKTLPWMSETTKAQAEQKLALYRNKIGYPEHWRDYSKFTVKRDDLLGNVDRGDEFERQRNLNKLGKPVDETEWGMTPPTVNAYYNPSQNDINFPAGILQPPFYQLSSDPAVNFGGIGVVIGHEMTHGFDDQGSKYDGHGNLREWQTPDDRKEFEQRTDCEVNEYNQFETAPGTHLNGQLTLGENTADNGGIRIAYMALMNTLQQEGAAAESRKIDGYTPDQRFFIAFGQIWCSNQTEQSARLLAKTDPHSTGKWRVDGTVQNFDAFARAFNCKKGQPMYPENSCRVW